LEQPNPDDPPVVVNVDLEILDILGVNDNLIIHHPLVVVDVDLEILYILGSMIR
jgi:hypothetical protein